MAPLLSVIAVFHNMNREALRTLATLTSGYQRGVGDIPYEVIAIDNGSSMPLTESDVIGCGPQFHYIYFPTSSVSPAAAVNHGVSVARGRCVCICIDGARMLSPGVLGNMLIAFKAFPNAFVSTLGWHLGSEVQNISVANGYCQEVEDSLLASVDWRLNGYALFSIASLALSCKDGWFSSIAESNCFAMPRINFIALGGFDDRFVSPGGGLVNLDFFSKACLSDALEPVLLFGEGSFHQFHGGVATNVPMSEHPWERFHDEYQSIRGHSYQPPTFTPYYMGRMPAEAKRFLA